jgi:hypothetical protein
MRFNELVRPAGIGRKQVAFDTSNVPSVLTQAETDVNNLEQTAQQTDAITSVTGFAESAAYSAATATQNEVRNFCYETTGIADTWFIGSVNINWRQSATVSNPFVFYDTRTQEFVLRKAGWYYINVFLYTTATNGAYDWWVSLQTNPSGPPGFNERAPTYIDYNHVSKYCHLNGGILYNSPTQGIGGQGERRILFRLGTTHAGSQTLTSANTIANLQIIYLGALPMSERALTPIV